MKSAVQPPVHGAEVDISKASASRDQVLRLERHLVHVAEDAATRGLGDPHSSRVSRAERRSGEPFRSERVNDKRRNVEAEIVKLGYTHVGVQDGEQCVRVHEQQALPSLNDEHVRIPVIDARLGIDKRAGPAAHQLQ